MPPLAPGFVGPGHLASLVVSPDDFALTDPFILLADDHLDIGERPVGGAHPHAGFETVTLILEGAIYDRDEGGVINTGEVQWMTAGRGIIHGENVATHGRVRLLQLWLTLPKADRWTTPAFQDIRAERGAGAPRTRRGGARLQRRVGRLPLGHAQPRAGDDWPRPCWRRTRRWNRTSRCRSTASCSCSTVPSPSARRASRPVRWAGSIVPTARATAWCVPPPVSEGARFVLYAGQPQHDPIVSHGPFIGDTREDIARLYSEYRAGTFTRMSELARAARV